MGESAEDQIEVSTTYNHMVIYYAEREHDVNRSRRWLP